MQRLLLHCFSFVFAFLIFITAGAQNLVVNPSFENTNNNCSGFPPFEGMENLLDWDQAIDIPAHDSCSTADFYSACNFGLSVPNNILGTQNAHSGTRYVGIITYDGIDEWREYVQGRLSTPLVAGQTYCVSMYVSLADNVIWATNNIGVYFSNTHYTRNPCPSNSRINVTPQLNYGCGAITDVSENWFRLQWDYTATGGEQYFIIGNFFNNANTTVVTTGVTSLNPYAYYYIDDVSVTPNACCYAEIRPHAPFCNNDAPSNLTVTTGLGSSCSPVLNGTWSGAGITNATAGTFSPSVAGAGVHVISYTLPCGFVDTQTIVVSPCMPLSVCSEPNGNYTASNGVGTYTWSQQVQQQDCSNCLPAVPPLIQPCSFPTGCAVTVNAWQDFSTNATITPPGTFPLRVVDDAGAELIITNAGSVTPCSVTCLLTASATPINTTCGSNNGGVTVSVSGGTPTAYSWSNSSNSSSLTNVAAGTYTVTVTAGSCTATASATVGSSSGVSLTPSSTNATCGVNNGSASISATGGSSYSYLWSNGGTTSSISNIAAGTYTVTVTSSNNCSATGSVVVATIGGVLATTSSANAGCTTMGSATVNATGGDGTFTYLWSNGGNTATISNLSGGTYTVTVTSSGCSATATATVASTGGGIVLSSSVTNTTCGSNNGAISITPTSGTLPFTYTWSNGGNTSSISNIAAGTYSATVTDGNGCSATLSAVVNSSTVAPALITTNDSLICSGDSTEICVQGNYTAYQWNTGQTTQCIFAKFAGNYYATAIDANNCAAASNRIAVSVYPLPPVSVSVNGDTLIAYNAVTYQWYYGTTPIPGATSNTYIAPQSGDYSVAVTDSNGCRATSTKISVVKTGILNIGKEDIKIYPNPLETGNWNLEGGDNLIGATVEIFDTDGRLIYKSEIRSRKSEIALDAASGIYVLHIRSSEVNYIHKLIKL